MTSSSRTPLLFLALSLLGCGRLGYEPRNDAASIDAHVSIDAPIDAARDAAASEDAPGPDAFSLIDADMDAPDAFVALDAAMLDAPLDAGSDAGSDAGRDAGRDGGRDAGRDVGSDAGTSPPTDRCPMLWSAGLAQQVNFRARAISSTAFFVDAQAPMAFSLGGSPSTTQSGLFLDALTGSYLAALPTGTNTLDAEVGLADRFFAATMQGFAELNPTTGALLLAGSNTPGSGNGGGDWFRREGRPWLYAITAHAAPQVLAGVGYSGPDTDVLVALVNPGTGAVTSARRLVFDGSQVVSYAWSLFGGEQLIGITNTTPGMLDGVPIPAGAVLLRLNASLNVIGARTYSAALLDTHPDRDILAYATSSELVAERADGTRLWARPISGMTAAHVQWLDDGSLLMVATINGVVTAFGQSWGEPGVVSAIGVFVDAAGTYLSGTQGVLGTGTILITGAAVSGDGFRAVLTGRSMNAEVRPCDTLLVDSSVANGTFLMAF